MDTFWQLVGGALRFEETAFRLIIALPTPNFIAFWVVFLAGLSEAVGQSVVLFINRVKRKRFVLSLLMSAAIFTFTFFFWALSVWSVGQLIFGGDASLRIVARAVGLGYAPMLFGFLVIVPHFGNPIWILLQLWSLLAVLVGVEIAFDFARWQALLTSILGWLVWQLLQSTIGRPLVFLARRLRHRAAGAPVVTDRQKLEQLLKAETTQLKKTLHESVEQDEDKI